MSDPKQARQDAQEAGRRARKAEQDARQDDRVTGRQGQKANRENANRKVQKSTGK